MRWMKFLAALLIAGSAVGCIQETVDAAVLSMIVQAIMDALSNLPL